MSHPKQANSRWKSSSEDDHELTFEHGYGAQEEVLSGETLADVAGVTEKDVRDDVLGTQQDEADDGLESESE